MAFRYVTRSGLWTAANTLTNIARNELNTAVPSERMPSSARRIVQIMGAIWATTPDLATSGGATLIRLTGSCLEHGEESIPFIGINTEATTAESVGRPCSVCKMDVDIPIKGNELLNIGIEQTGTVWDTAGGGASITVVVEY